jgi:2-polyprenyl-6-methoxyphenol hydroxylase-like FAD-dependent oxidoreductase
MLGHELAPGDEASVSVDIVVVGGGISGALAAAILGRAGHHVCLIDRNAIYPPDFRAEHLDGPMIGQLRRLGFLDDLTLGIGRGETVALARHGRIITSARTVNYGLRYETLVNRARNSLPPTVRMIVGRVVGLEASARVQLIRLADGRTINARLTIIATGQSYALCKQLGMSRRMIRESHSLTFGFNIEPIATSHFPHSFLIYQPEKITDRIDYLAAFTMNQTTRVNLFTYRGYREPWTRAFMDNPGHGLGELLPGFARVMGPYRSVGGAVARPIDLYVSQGHRRAGVVLIGDAFQATCPATGMGMARLLTDIERLCRVHLPMWFATPGMDADKIATFYDDPIKRACDAKAMHDAEYRRSVSIETDLAWCLHRARVRTMLRLSTWWHGAMMASNPRMAEANPQPSQPVGLSGKSGFFGI